MHNPDYTPSTSNTSIGGLVHNDTSFSHTTTSQIRVQFSAYQRAPEDRKLGDLMREHIERKEFFYGIELTARSFGQPVTLDYNSFGTLLPLFTSLVWLGQDYWQADRVTDVESVQVAMQLQPHTIVMPHFSCYRADRKRLSEFLALNFANVLALRGDQVEPEQEFQHASDLVSEMRRLRGDTISIGVGGYPEGHPDAKSLEEDMKFLIKKVNAGADFIITQICFSADSVVQFIKASRANGITVPIIVGVFVPENMRTLRRMSEITQVQIPTEQLVQYEALAGSTVAFRAYAEEQAVDFVNTVFDSNLDIYGIQFFTMNKLKNIQRVLNAIVESRNMENKIKT